MACSHPHSDDTRNGHAHMNGDHSHTHSHATEDANHHAAAEDVSLAEDHHEHTRTHGDLAQTNLAEAKANQRCVCALVFHACGARA